MMPGRVWTAGILILVASLIWALTVRTGSAGTTYRFVEVTRGDLESTVTATGALQATETVEVGTQVSGQIAEIYADFNDRVPQGQLVARIDATILEQEVRSAEVNLARNQAELDQARRDLERVVELNGKGVIAVNDVEASEYRFALADAGYRTAEINLERARRNLEYTEIRAPIAGVVVARNVEVGQTVAASLSAPVLFVLAQDLAQMEILASVDESDIGQIAEGQKVHFTVQAYPDRQFEGTVRQVRLEATTRENVVTYSVVVAVGNEDGSLLPGMTATLDVVIETAEDVLMVPNTALRFRATEEMLASVTLDRDPSGPAPDRATGGRSPDRQRTGSRQSATPSGGSAGTLWFQRDTGELSVARVRTGLSDGIQTVITNAPNEVGEGLEVIAAVTTASTTAIVENPFQTQQQPQAGPGGGRGGR